MDSSLVHNQLRAPAVIQCSSLAKQIIRRRPNQLTSAAASCTILESANDACGRARQLATNQAGCASQFISNCVNARTQRSEEHTSELQSQSNLVCRLLLEKKKHMTSIA